MSTVLSEMSVLIMCVCICVCTCVCTCGKAVVLPVLHKIIINKDDTNFYCNLNRYLMQPIIDIKSLKSIFGEFCAQQKDLQSHIVFLCKQKLLLFYTKLYIFLSIRIKIIAIQNIKSLISKNIKMDNAFCSNVTNLENPF